MPAILRALALVALCLTLVPLAKSQTISIDASSPGKIFQGVGAISGGGGNSRLLIDYPEPQRSQILDYLFKPNYGASLQILKVEIGADMDSTDGAESSHSHTAGDENYNRGYEWWLMEQAKARNPAIKLVALAWGAPHWVGNGEYWSPDMIAYIIQWIKHAQSDHHLTIDDLGGRNEHGYNIQWYKDLKAALRANGLGNIKVIASDDWEPPKRWNIALDMAKDPALNDAIDIVGVHGPNWSTAPPPEAYALKKPLWDSEGHFDEKRGDMQMARTINRNYAAIHMDATVFWPIVSAMYDNLPYDDIGLIKCNQPWSGHYTVTPSVWAMAHTTQFVRPGWQYLDNASGFFAADPTGTHGSYVTLRSPDSRDFSLIIETMPATPQATQTTEPQTGNQTVHFSLAGFPRKPLHLWATDLTSSDPTGSFAKQADIVPINREFSLDLQPGHLYTVTTTTGQSKGAAAAPLSAPFPLPYADNFDAYRTGTLAKYFSDMYGAFETTPCDAGRSGMCLTQLVPAEPIHWKPTAGRPFTMLGSLDWTDYTLSTDILFEQPGSIDLIGRLTGMGDTDVPNAYVLRLSDTGAWSLLRTATKGEDVTLASGSIDAPGLHHWHRIALTFSGPTITPRIDNSALPPTTDTTYAKGMVGLGVLNYARAQFDNLRIDPPQ
jgi:hypothetical protein